MLHRRHLLQRLALLGAAGLAPRLARARAGVAAGTDLRFVFVMAQGGWDTTRVFVPPWDTPGAAVERDAVRATTGGVTWVDHPERPAVRAFMTRWAGEAVLLNGMLVRSIAHDPCRRILLTGVPSGDIADWPAILAAEARETYVLPHVVLGGPSFAGDLGAGVARTGAYGQLDALLTGDALDGLEQAVTPLPGPAHALVDRWLARRGPAFAAGETSVRGRALARAWEDARGRAVDLQDLAWTLSLGQAADMAGKVALACELLSQGIARCVSLDTGGGSLVWDTHSDNDVRQTPLWDSMCAGLSQLMEGLARTPGVSAPRLLDETCVVVLSEMGRTPALNAANGKDHWPSTSALMLGAGITSGRVIGGHDETFGGRAIDPRTGALDAAGVVPTAQMLGASLLALGDVDPEAWDREAPTLAL